MPSKRGKRFSESEISAALADTEKMSAAEVSKKHGVSQNTLYRWKSERSQTAAKQSRTLKDLELENATLKRVLGEQALELYILRHK